MKIVPKWFNKKIMLFFILGHSFLIASTLHISHTNSIFVTSISCSDLQMQTLQNNACCDKHHGSPKAKSVPWICHQS